MNRMRPPRLAAPRLDRAELVDDAAVVVLVAVALWSFRSSYGGWAFLVNGVVAAVAGVAIARVAARRRWPLPVTAVAAVTSYALLASVIAVRRLAWFGVLPSAASVSTSLTKTVTGWKELVTTAPPVGYTGDLMAVPVFAAMLAAPAMALLAARSRTVLVAGVVPLIVLGLGIATGTLEPVSLIVNGAVLAVLTFAWLTVRAHRTRELVRTARVPRRQLASGLVMLSVAGVGALAVAPRLPFAERVDRTIWRQTVTPPFDPRVYPSPLTSYRAYVKAGVPDPSTGLRIDAPVMFTIEGLPEGIPVRLATMDTYDGLVWQVSAGDPANPSLRDSGSFERVGASLPPDVEGETAEVVVTIRDYADVWVPDVGEVISIRFTGSAGGPERDRALADSFRYNRETDTAATPLRLRAGDRYEMTVRLPAVVDRMTGLELDPDVARIGLAAAVGPVVEQLNTPELAAMETANERLDAVAETMRKYGAYSDGDRSLGQILALSGHSARRLAEFVDDFPSRPLIGNAEQYAATYALFFRSVDRLPTRVVMGFVPSAASTEGPVEVTATEVEAWVEVPVRELGWVMIAPTPDREQRAASTTSPVNPDPDYRTQNPPPPPLIDPEFEQPATVKGDVEPTAEAEEPEVAEPDSGRGSALAELVSRPAVVVALIVASPFVLVALAGGVIVAVKALRRRRRRTRGAPHQRIANGWREVTDLASDLGRPIPRGTTRREEAAFASPLAQPVAARADAAIWSADDLSDADVDAYWDEILSTLRSMRRDVGLVGRSRAAISPHSLRRSVAGRADAETAGSRP